MAFTGTPVVVQISDRECRITGVTLAAGASGVIGLAAKTAAAEVPLPAGFIPGEYVGPSGHTVTLIESIDVTAKPAATGTAVAIPVSVVKTGVDPQNWIATLTNTHASTATPSLEIYVKFHD